MKKSSHKILKSVALAGALTATGAVATTAHADTAKASAPVQGVASTDQQLTNLKNLKSQQTANESAVASSNAATMSAATTSASSQIADLNNKIKERQASDAATKQNKIDQVNKDAQAATNAENSAYSSAVAKQKVANDEELKNAQSTIVTEQQKEEQKNQATSNYKNNQQGLLANHQNKLNQLKSQHEQNTQKLNSQINTINEHKQQQANEILNKQINNANTALQDAKNNQANLQKRVNLLVESNQKFSDENKKNELANKKAQASLNKLKDNLKEQLNRTGSDDVYVPDSYVNAWKKLIKRRQAEHWNFKEYNSAMNSDKDLYQASKDLYEGRYNFVTDPSDYYTYVDYNADGTLSDEAAKVFSVYSAGVLNNIRKRIGVAPLRVDKQSVTFSQQISKQYGDDNWSGFKKGHDGHALTVGSNHHWTGENLHVADDLHDKIINHQQLSVADIKKSANQAIIDYLAENYLYHIGYGHAANNVGAYSPNDTHVYFGASIDKYGDGHFNWFYPTKEQTSANDYKLPSLHGVFSINEVKAQNEKIINDVQASADAISKSFDNSKAELSKSNEDLAQAKDELQSAKAATQKAQESLDAINNNHSDLLKKAIQQVSADTLNQINSLKKEISDINIQYNKAVQQENSDFNAKSNSLKSNYEQQIKAIAAQPTSLAELQTQLQAKLDTLKAKHDAKLKQINDDANAKIEAIKNQKVDDPEIDKLNAQIDQIKSDLAKKQQELDSQYEALKTKNQAEYNALANKLNSSTKALANGSTQQVFTSRSGKVAYVVPGQQSLATKGVVKTVSEQNNSDSLSKEFQSQNNNRLPQTGNQSSLAMVLLGAAAAMFGVGLAGKKKEY